MPSSAVTATLPVVWSFHSPMSVSPVWPRTLMVLLPVSISMDSEPLFASLMLPVLGEIVIVLPRRSSGVRSSGFPSASVAPCVVSATSPRSLIENSTPLKVKLKLWPSAFFASWSAPSCLMPPMMTAALVSPFGQAMSTREPLPRFRPLLVLLRAVYRTWSAMPPKRSPMVQR
jgi:hypothetical protein